MYLTIRTRGDAKDDINERVYVETICIKLAKGDIIYDRLGRLIHNRSRLGRAIGFYNYYYYYYYYYYCYYYYHHHHHYHCCC